MRLRKKKWAAPLMDAHPELMVQDPLPLKGSWEDRFDQTQPLQLEVGMGKGNFVIGMAQAHPDINFIGLEIEPSVAAIALKKALPLHLSNLQLVRADAGDLREMFSDNEIERLYLNFSDPWPKKRHTKRRLTYHTFLEQYEHILVPSGTIELKTDNMGFFEYSLQSLNNYGMEFDGVWLDLHHSPENDHNIETEYEHRFAEEKGQPIYKVTAHFDPQK